jgi:putative SOS response-associated peptidase YedK
MIGGIMCGRFTLILEPDDLEEELNLGQVTTEYSPRYNVAPTQPVAFVADSAVQKVEMFRWGLIPSWAKDPEIGSRMINARAETLQEKPAFKQAFMHRRGLVLASGFYEWKKENGGKNALKTPLYFKLTHQRAFAFAGLWELWKPAEGEPVKSCTIITCAANELMAPVHDRMPVILDKERMLRWLDPRTPLNEAYVLLAPYPAGEMEMYPVSTLVNNPRVDRAECILPTATLGI